MEKISFDPMVFGSENDLKIALMELRWVWINKGRLTNSEFKTIADKYKFPSDFLKKGLEGFTYPEDYMISKSEWFPIIYSWVVNDSKLSLNLFKLQFDYIRKRYYYTLILGLLGNVFFFATTTINQIFSLQLLELTLLCITFTLSWIALLVELLNNLGERKIRTEEYIYFLENSGRRYIVDNNNSFIQQHLRYIIHAGGIILKKMQSGPTITAFHMGETEYDKEPSKLYKLMNKLRILPKSFSRSKKETVPIFYAENVFLEYQKRIEELKKSIETKKGK